MRELGAGAVAALGVLAGAAIAQGRLGPSPLALWAALAAGALTVAGMALARRTSDLAVFAGLVVGAAAAMLVGGTALAVGLLATAALAVMPTLERLGLLGTIIRAPVFAAPLVYGALVAGRPIAGLVPWTLGSWMLLVRSLAAETEGGRGNRWLAAALAIGFVPVSLLLPARAGYGGTYFIIELFAQLAVLAVATRLMVGRTDGLAILLTGATLVGLVALVAGRVV